VRFEGGDLAGPQIVTATAEGHAASTWFGVDGAVVTIPLAPHGIGDIPTARVSGTIAGWSGLPDPAPGCVLAATVAHTFGRSDVAIEQAPHPNPELAKAGWTQNMCARWLPPYPPVDECDWTLKTRTGPQAIYVTIASLDVAPPDSDPEVIGYAFKTGFNLSEGDVQEGIVLEWAPLISVAFGFAKRPAGLISPAAAAAIDLGEAGILTAGWFTAGPTWPFPKASGDLAGTYFAWAKAIGDPKDPFPVGVVYARGVADLDGEVLFGEWLGLPAAVEVGFADDRSTYSFGGVEGASWYAIAVSEPSGSPAWNVRLLQPVGEPGAGQDPRMTFDLPVLSPDPLPSPSMDVAVHADEVPGLDPAEFELDVLYDVVSRSSADSERFRR